MRLLRPYIVDVDDAMESIVDVDDAMESIDDTVDTMESIVAIDGADATDGIRMT